LTRVGWLFDFKNKSQVFEKIEIEENQAHAPLLPLPSFIDRLAN
jgi:hypothetical protein